MAEGGGDQIEIPVGECWNSPPLSRNLNPHPTSGNPGHQQAVDEVLTQVRADMRNKEQVKMESTIELKSHGMILRSLNFLEQLKLKFPDVNVLLHDCNTKVTYLGKRGEVEKCEKEIANFFSTLGTVTLKMTRLQIELLSNPETLRYLRSLLERENISCMLKVHEEGKLVLICQQRDDLEKAKAILEQNIQHKIFPLQKYPLVSEMSHQNVGLSQEERTRVIIKKIDEEVHVAATRDVMGHITEWIKIKDTKQSRSRVHQTQQCSPGVQQQQPLQSVQSVEVHWKVSELDIRLCNGLGIVDRFKQCTAGNGEIVIEASECDARKISEEIQKIQGIKTNREICHLNGECSVLLKHQETKDYVTKELQRGNHRCVWNLGTDSTTIEIYALTKSEAVNAGKSVGMMMSAMSLKAEVNDVGKLLKDKSFNHVLLKYQGKAEVDHTSDEVGLVATADAMEEIQKVIRDYKTCINTETLTCLEMPEGICEYILENPGKFAIKLKHKYDVSLVPFENKRKLKLTGPMKNLPIVKSALEKEVADLDSKSVRVKSLPTVVTDDKVKQKFELKNNCYLSTKEERVILKPCPSHTWVMKNSLYVMLVSGNIAETNVYSVVCPVDVKLKPMGAGQTIMAYGGRSLEEDLQQNGGQSPAFNKKPDFQQYFSLETGNLHCSSIIYTDFPGQDVKSSGMSTSKSVVVSKIKKTLDVAESKGVFSLAIPLDLSSVTSLQVCMHAVAESLCSYVGYLKHLREVYLYCPDQELENAREIFTQAFWSHLKSSVDFSALVKGQERRRNSPIQLDILEGSLADQKMDVLVNTTNPELDLDQGLVSITILQKAGREIQDECREYYEGGIGVGDVAWTSAGKIPHVKHIFHVVLPHWQPTGNFSLMVLELLITKCLIEADKMKMHSIAFPVLGTGNLLYPQHLVAKTMYDTVVKYGRNAKTKIKTVKFVIYDTDVLQVFRIYEEYKSFGRSESEAENPPYHIIEARIPKPGTSVQIQVLPFWGCWWRVQALVEFVTIGQVSADPQYEKLCDKGFTKEWITKDSQYYLRILMMCDSDDVITKGIKQALKITSEERITSLGFVVVTLEDPAMKKLTSKDQAKMIKKAVLDVKDDNKYLQEIKILVKSMEDFACFLSHKESQAETKEHGVLSKLKSIPSAVSNLFDTSKCPWKIVRYMKRSNSGLTVTVVTNKGNIANILEQLKFETDNQDTTRRDDINDGGYHDDMSNVGDGRVQGATGGYHGNQAYSGDGREQGATGGHHGNHTYYGDGGVQGATGGHLGNHTYSGDGRLQGATCGLHGNQTYSRDGRSQGDIDGSNGYHDNKQNNQTRHSQVQSIQQEGKEVFPVQDMNDVFETVEAVVNPRIVQASQWETVLEGHGDVEKDGRIVCKDLQSLEKVDGVLQDKFSIKVDDSKDHFSHPHDDDFEHISDINIPMSEEDSLAIQFFCRGEKALDQQAVGYRDGMLQITCNDSSDKKVVQACIESKLKHLEVMNKDDVSYTSAEEPKIKEIIKQIHDTVDGVFCYQLGKDEHSMVHLMAFSYSQLQTAKHKISLGLGRIKQTETRRNRRFDKTPLQQGDSTPTDKSRLSQSYSGNQSSWKPPTTAGYGSVSPKDFTTPEGLLVRIYPGSILSLDVDCIVNAANGDLLHGGGVAQVISNAAGYEFDKESRDYIYNNGPLGVGQVCTTTAGNLKYKGVIHAVGPRWYDYNQDQKWICLSDLKTAVKNSLEEADFQRYRSIAIPAISSGIFGVPKELCVQQYYRAVEEYSRSRGHNSTLTEVHFIDKDTHMCQLIQTTFTGCFNGTSGIAAGKSGYQRNQLAASAHPVKQTNNPPQIFRSLSSDERSLTHNSDESDQYGKRSKHMTLSQLGDSKDCYQIGNCLSVYIVCGDIIEATTEAIICPENEQFDGRGSIARTIRKAATETYIEKLKQLVLHKRQHKMSEVLEISASGSAWKVVLHVIAPRWDDMAVKDPQKYEKNLRQAYENILRHMDKHDLNTLAVPVLGTGAHMHTTPYATIPEIMVSVFKQFANRIRNRKEVYVFCKDKTLLSPIRDVFNKEFNEDESPDEQRNAIQTERIERGFSSKDKQESVDTPEDCCICMDTVTNPKKLSCGHVFCTDCIDQQFKYKPACPQCGAVHGKITGDQPPGTMTMTTTKPYWGRGSLPGYEGCGIININYHFPSGKQGPDHPTPGKLYQGITRPGFLPDNEKGRLVAKLLRIAFDRKLVFTIGRSRTTGHDGVVTWNDIHHKTRMDGGPQAFGYPDPTYLDRVLDELKAKGVTEESLNDP